MNILIVEDDTAIREGVAEFLKENEYEVFCAGDGEKALEILKSKEIWHCWTLCCQRKMGSKC